MRSETKNKLTHGAAAMLAAGFATVLGTSAAKGDFIFQVTNPESTIVPAENGQDNPNTPPTGVTATTGVVDDWVIAAENTGTNGTGTDLAAVDVTLTVTSPSGGTLVFDVFKASSKSAVSVSVDGLKDVNTVGFGDPKGGTYVGIGASPITSPSYTGAYDPQNNGVGVSSSWEAEAENNNGVSVSGGLNATKNTSLAGLDQNFISNTVHTFELAGILPAGSGIPASPTDGYVPFANIVVPAGSTGTAAISIGGDVGGAQNYTVTFGGTAPPPPTTPTVSLTTSAPTGSNEIAAVSLVGGNQHYTKQTFSVTGAAQTNGYLAVSGFNPTSDEEIYGLGGTGLAGLASTLTSAITSPSGASVVPVSSLSAALQGILAGDTLAAIFPTGSSPTGTPNYFAYNLQGTTATITSITVVPEPTGIGALVLGGIGLLSRRKARKIA